MLSIGDLFGLAAVQREKRSPLLDPELHDLVLAQHQRTAYKRVRGNGYEHVARHVARDQRPTRREGVGRGPQRCGGDQPIALVGDEVFPVYGHVDRGDLVRPLLEDHRIVYGRANLVLALHPNLEHPVLLDVQLAIEHLVHPGVEILGAHPAHEAHRTEVDPEQHQPRVHPRGSEHRPISAEHEDEVEIPIHPIPRRFAEPLDLDPSLPQDLDEPLRVPVVHRRVRDDPDPPHLLLFPAQRSPPTATRMRPSSRVVLPPRKSRKGYSTFPARLPATGECVTSTAPKPEDSNASATPRTAAARTAGSRTSPPRPTCSGPASNCGLTSNTASSIEGDVERRFPSATAREIKDRSATRRSGVNGRSSLER